MLPDWMKETDDYAPDNSGHSFILKSYMSLGRAMSGISVQRHVEGEKSLPALLKLIVAVLLIIAVSVFRNPFFIMGVAAVVLLYVSTMKPEDILSVLKPAFVAGFLAFIIVLPAAFLNPAGIKNNIILVLRVILSVVIISIFNHTTQWNRVTAALADLHVPGIFIFILDITLKYIALMGKIIEEMLTALLLKSVGKNNKKYQSVGGVMGMTFIRGMECNAQMYEAMQCRGFSGEYKSK